MKTRINILLVLGVIGLVALLWVRRPIAPDGQKPGGRTNAAPSAIEAFVERRAKQRQKSQERRMSEQELLQFALPLDTVPQRQEFYDNLLKQPPLKLYHAWEGSLGSDKERHKGMLEVALADSLKQSADQPEAKAVYLEAAKFLGDSNESESSKIRMVKWIGQSGTPEALALLLDSLGPATKELKFELLRQLAAVGNSRWDRAQAEELSALLQQKWPEATAVGQTNRALLAGLSQALAKVGHPSGVELLLAEVSRPHDPQDQRFLTAFNSFKEIRNPSSAPVLTAALAGQSPNSAVLFAAGRGLAGIGDEQATLGLIRWAREASDEYAQSADFLFSQLWHPVAIKKVRYVFIDNDPFKSPQMRAAVQGALARLP